MEHGTRSTYCNNGCRCDDCCAANRAYQQEWYQRNREARIREVVEYNRSHPKRSEWVKRHEQKPGPAAKHADRERARRAKRFSDDAEDIIGSLVYQRDRGICGICGGKVDPFDFHVDHIRPLSKDGTHTWDNVQLAHPRCNLKKGAK